MTPKLVAQPLYGAFHRMNELALFQSQLRQQAPAARRWQSHGFNRLVIGLYLMMSTLPSEELSGFKFILYYWQPSLNFVPSSRTSVYWDRPPASRPSRSQALPRSPKPLSSWSRSVRRV